LSFLPTPFNMIVKWYYVSWLLVLPNVFQKCDAYGWFFFFITVTVGVKGQVYAGLLLLVVIF
jgi:hypothetical protein